MPKRIQPLSYQVHLNSCWTTSVSNALLVLYRDKDKIPTLAYRLLNAVLTNDGVLSTGTSGKDWRIVLEALSIATGFSIQTFEGDQVEGALRELHFKKQVAVCDTELGGHSILLTGKNAKNLQGFDPDWNNVKDGSNSDHLHLYPDSEPGAQCHINFEVDLEHFAAVKQRTSLKLRMGRVPERVMTVFERH